MKFLIHIDGGSRGNPGPAAAGVVIQRINHDGEPARILHEAGYHLGRLTNNVAEYTALLRALNIAASGGPDELIIHSDSELMVKQLTGEYRVKSPDLQPLFQDAQALLLKFDLWRIQHVPREKNRRADELANMAMDAGKDVVLRAIDGTTPTVAPRPAPEAPARANAAKSDTLRFTATLEADPGRKCPAACRAGRPYAFGPATPPGFCIYAAQVTLDEIAWNQQPDAKDAVTQATAECNRCGVLIRIKMEA